MDASTLPSAPAQGLLDVCPPPESDSGTSEGNRLESRCTAPGAGQCLHDREQECARNRALIQTPRPQPKSSGLPFDDFSPLHSPQHSPKAMLGLGLAVGVLCPVRVSGWVARPAQLASATPPPAPPAGGRAGGAAAGGGRGAEQAAQRAVHPAGAAAPAAASAAPHRCAAGRPCSSGRCWHLDVQIIDLAPV